MAHSSAAPVNTHVTSPGRVGISSPRGRPLDLNLKSNLDLLVILVLAAQLCPTVCEPMDCSSPDSSVHGILQADILEWVAIAFSRGPFRPRDQIWVSWIGRQTVCHLSQASCATSLGLIIVIHRTALIILTIQPSVCFKKTKASC